MKNATEAVNGDFTVELLSYPHRRAMADEFDKAMGEKAQGKPEEASRQVTAFLANSKPRLEICANSSLDLGHCLQGIACFSQRCVPNRSGSHSYWSDCVSEPNQCPLPPSQASE